MPVAFAFGAAPPFDIERKKAGRITPGFGQGLIGIKAADVVVGLEIGYRV
jgi:hypothetical protein